MALSTAEAIRDRNLDIIEAVDPVSLTSTRFRRYRNEGKGDFRTVMESQPAASLRRFQARNIGNDEPPAVSNMSFEERRLSLEIVIAYPQDHHAGPANALDRDDMIEQDWVEIDTNIGITGRGNFGSTYDCTPIGCTKEIERGEVCDFLVIRAEFIYQRALSIGGLVSELGAGLGG